MDSDDDGAPDWFEISYMGYNVDTDKDGLMNPYDWDSDGDLISDGDEIRIDDETDDVSIIKNPLVYNDPIEVETGYEGIKVLKDYKISVIVNTNRETGAEQGKTDIGIDITVSSPPEEYPWIVSSVFDISTSSDIDNGIVKKQILTDGISDYSTLRWYKYTPDGWEVLSGGINTGGPNSTHQFVWGQFSSFSEIAIGDSSQNDGDNDGLDDNLETEGNAQYWDLGGVHPDHEISNIQTDRADIYVRMKKDVGGERKVQLKAKSWSATSYNTRWEYAISEDYRWYPLRFETGVSGGIKLTSDNPSDILIDKIYLRNSPADRPPTDPHNPDCDGDGLKDGEEFQNQKTIEFESGVEFDVTGTYEEKTMLSAIGPVGWPKEAEVSLKITPPDDTEDNTLSVGAWQKTDPMSYRLEEPAIGSVDIKGGENPVTISRIFEYGYLTHLHYEYDWVVAVDDGSVTYDVTVSDYKLTVETHQNPLSKDSDGDGLGDDEEVNKEVVRYIIDKEEKGYSFSIEEPDIYDDIFYYRTNPLLKDSDLDGQTDKNDLIPLDYDMDGDRYINCVGIVSEGSSYYVERLDIAVSLDSYLHDPSIMDTDMDGDGIPNINDDDCDNDGMNDNYETVHGVSNNGWQNPYVHNNRFALLICGGHSNEDKYFSSFWSATKDFYEKLTDDYLYKEEYVYLMSSRWNVEMNDGSYEWKGHNSITDDIVDGECIWDTDVLDIKEAIHRIGEKTTRNDFIFTSIYSHGWTLGFTAQNTDDAGQIHMVDYFSQENIFHEINKTWGGGEGYQKKYARAVMVIDTCSSEFPAWGFSNGTDRIGISAAENNEESYTKLGSNNGKSAFLQESKEVVYPLGVINPEVHIGLIPNLGNIENEKSIYFAYEKGYNAASHNYIHYATGGVINEGRSYPQIFKEDLAKNTYL